MQAEENAPDIKIPHEDSEENLKNIKFFEDAMLRSSKMPASGFISDEDYKCRTKGGVILSKVEVGDILYEFEYGAGIASMVISKPIKSEDNKWTWKAENVNNPGHFIDYMMTEGYSHYGPNIYSYKAYHCENWI